MSNNDAIAELTELLTEKKEKKQEFRDVEVKREGSQIVLPEGMPYSEGHKWLDRAEEAEETPVNVRAEIECYPLDGALALSKALKQLYGFTHLQGKKGLFGRSAPTMVTIPTGVDSQESVMWGSFSPPGMEDGELTTSMDFSGLPKFIINGTVKRKYKQQVHRIIEVTKEIVKTDSIYKGKAVRVDLSYLDGSSRFDPVSSAPNFMDLRDVNLDDLILNRQTEYDITVSIWSRIERTADIRSIDVPLKHGVLLSGEYGTGKTMTARMTAKRAQDNGWTFIYLEDSTQLADALRFAETYAPAVLFAEDIDKAVEGSERTSRVNKILNTLDGVDTKDKPIITVLTTNHPENINRAFLRAGRIDSVIPMTAPDAETAKRFIEYYAGDLLADDADLDSAADKMEGFVAAFIDEAVNKAKMFAISREGRDIKGKVTGADLEGAADTLIAHKEMVEAKAELTPEEELAKAVNIIEGYKNNNSEQGEDVLEIKSTVERIRDGLF